jgi:hypothetical protein
MEWALTLPNLRQMDAYSDPEGDELVIGFHPGGKPIL